jgi:hypothetical protein
MNRHTLLPLALLTMLGCRNNGTLLEATAVSPGDPPCQDSGVTHCSRHVAKAIQLPANENDDSAFPLALKAPRNQLGALVGLLKSLGFDWQAEIDDAVAKGQEILLLDIASSDPKFAQDWPTNGAPPPAAGIYIGQPTSQPDYSGDGHFTIDGSFASSHLSGFIDFQFYSDAQHEPAPVLLRLPWGAGAKIDLPFAVANLRLPAYDGDAILEGALKTADVQGALVPALARRFADAVKTGAANAALLLQTFDNGGKAQGTCASQGVCTNSDGTCGVAHDNAIQECEVATHATVQTAVASDINVFDANGKYNLFLSGAPDSMSFGISLTTVHAAF